MNRGSNIGKDVRFAAKVQKNHPSSLFLSLSPSGRKLSKERSRTRENLYANGDRSLAYRIRHLDRDRTGSWGEGRRGGGGEGKGLAGYIRVEMETLAKIFSVPEITNMPPTRRVHSFSANGSGMKLLKPIPFETSRFPEWGTPFSHLLFKLENFRTRFSTPGLASERNRITCCIFVGQDRKRSRDYNQTIFLRSLQMFKVQSSKQNFVRFRNGFEARALSRGIGPRWKDPAALSSPLASRLALLRQNV